MQRVSRMVKHLGFQAIAAVFLLAGPAAAQNLNLEGGKDGAPVEVFADNGIEWQQDGQIFIARGNARAVRGDMVVRAEELRAYYRADDAGSTQIWRLDALGSVKITSAEETVFGDKGIYDLDNSILVMTGKNLKLVTPTQELTARDSLEYWIAKEMAVARGDALAINADKRVKADVLTALFKKDKSGKSSARQINAFGNVVIATKQDIVKADKAVYNVRSGIARMSGAVEMTRGKNKLNGCSAEVNMNTQVSKLFACKKSSDGRVKGTITPQQR